VRQIFVDTLYWLALFVPGDEWNTAARSTDTSDARLITTEEVLGEFLTAVCGHGEYVRRLACRAVREILSDPGVEVVVQYHESFLAGLALYERRPDKAYSLTDCISINVMRQRRVHEVLTHDRHFSQEGFTRLLP
jgi:predicted nucleic acid-binding protein